MKKCIYFSFGLGLLAVLLTHTLSAQNRISEKINATKRTSSIREFQLFSTVNNSTLELDKSIFKENTEQAFLQINQSSLANLVASTPELLGLTIPITEKNTIELELVPINIFADGFQVVNSNGKIVDFERSLYYQGIVKGDSRSVVSISISQNSVKGMISTAKGNFILGKVKSSETYIFYNDNDLNELAGFECGVLDEDLKHNLEQIDVPPSFTNTTVSCRAIQIYVEADNKIYTDNGSSVATASQTVNDLFGQVAVLYANENIAIQISQLKVWDTVDPYVGTTTTGAMLTSFSNQVGNTFTGDVAHLLSGRNLNGGIAGLNVLCSKGKGISAGISNVIVNVPSYSNDILIVTHELGHNFGSPHTHSCSCPGGPIDNCETQEGTCTAGPSPQPGGGTIMSYCHITAIGTNFANGFGPLPGNLIRLRTEQCLGSAVTPTNLATVAPYGTSVLLAWDHSAGGTFTIRYKAATSGTWITLPTTPNKYIQITGLTANTNYNWQVKSNCSAYASANFATNSEPALNYCTPTVSIPCTNLNIAINDFTLNSVNWNPNSGCSSGGTSLQFNPVRFLTPGSTYSFVINPLWIGGNDFGVSIWIDYNKNGVFSTDERVFTTTSRNNTTVNGTFSIPGAQPLRQNTRLRVVLDFDTSSPSNPCGSFRYGEVEDYLVNIGADPCPTSLTLTKPANNITSGVVKYETSGILTATNAITGGNVKYDAGRNIQLNPGFSVNSGVVFSAYIDGCGGQ